jgi:hypothetical protein
MISPLEPKIRANTEAIDALRLDLKLVASAVRALCEKAGVTDKKLMDALSAVAVRSR